MKKVNEEQLLAILFSNFSGKGKQVHDWIFIAEKMQELKDIYKSDDKVAKNLSLSREMVRSTLKLLELPTEIKSMVKEGKVSQDLAWRLLGIKNKSSQISAANSVQGLSAHDARDIIRYAKNNPEIQIDKYVNRLTNFHKLKENLNLVVLSLDEGDFKKLKELARKENKSINALVTDLVLEKIKKWV